MIKEIFHELACLLSTNGFARVYGQRMNCGNGRRSHIAFEQMHLFVCVRRVKTGESSNEEKERKTEKIHSTVRGFASDRNDETFLMYAFRKRCYEKVHFVLL